MNRRTYLFLVVGAVGLVFTGCAAALLAGGVAAGAGTVLYVKGDLQTTIERPYDDVWDASLEGIRALGLRPSRRDKGAEKGVIKTRRLDGKSVTILVYPQTRRTTKLSIRVGTFGDEESSLEILKAIEAKL